MWGNTSERYGWVGIGLHWLIAVAVVGLFALGVWMTDLAYTHPWYNRAPALHKSIGMLVLAVVALRLAWRLVMPVPAFDPALARWERRAALAAHRLMYLLTIAVVVSGYLIPTAEGDPVSVFGRLEVPALVHLEPGQADLAGRVHDWSAWILIGVAVVHAAAALKHHWINRDDTLRRMLRPQP